MKNCRDISAQDSDNQVQLLILLSLLLVFPLSYFQDHGFGCLLLVVNVVEVCHGVVQI